MPKHLFVTLLALLISVGMASGEKIKFKNGELITDYLGSNPCTTTTYGANGEVGMATICAAKPDSSVGIRAQSSAQRQHLIGQNTAQWAPDTSRVLIRLDISIIPNSAFVVGARLKLPAVGAYGNCVNYCYVRCAPLCSRRPWNSASEAPLQKLWVFAETDTAPTWTDYKYWPGGGGDSLWTMAGCDSARSVDWDPGDKADRWEAVTATYGAYSGGTLDFNVTAALQWDLADSTIDISNCGFILWVDEEATANTGVKVADHWCTTTANRPWLEVEYVDTTHVTTIPLQLGRGGLAPAGTYQDVHQRPTTGRFVWVADWHTCSYACGGLGNDDWRSPIKIARICANMKPKPVAVFGGGDYCINSLLTCPSPVDSFHFVEQILTDAGIEFYPILGNHEGPFVGGSSDYYAYARSVMSEFTAEHYYDVDLGFARCWCVNSITGWPDNQTAANLCLADSLGSPYSVQRQWLIRTMNQTATRKAKFILGHTNLFNPFTDAKRCDLRDWPDWAAGKADSMCQAIQRAGAWAWFSGHNHTLARTHPLVISGAVDTVLAHPLPANGQMATGDSAVIYITSSFTWAGPAVPKAAKLAKGWFARWEDPTQIPMYTVVDVMGNWWRAQTFDTLGACYDTASVKRPL